MVAKIIRNSQVCLRDRYKKSDCLQCHLACPQGCINENLDFDLSNCNQCGLCLSVCPAEAIAGEEYSSKSYSDLLESTQSPVYLSCTRQDKRGNWPCLGFLDARLLLALVYSGKNGNRQVIIDNHACLNCNPKVADYLSNLFTALNSILAFAEKELLVMGPNGYKNKEKVISRRDLAKFLLGQTIMVIADAIEYDGTPEPVTRQKFFSDYVGPSSLAKIAPTELFHGIAIAENCRACGLCEKICPRHAIKIETNESVLDFYHYAFRCTGCGVCAANCPEDALTIVHVNNLDKMHIKARILPSCKECGRFYQPIESSEICIECYLKQNSF